MLEGLVSTGVPGRAPERWERWERVPSQHEILAATFDYPIELASKISVTSQNELPGTKVASQIGLKAPPKRILKKRQ